MRKPHPLYNWALQAPAPLRWSLGLLLIVGGVLGFLPVLGFWMIPLGVMLVASGSPRVRHVAKRAIRWGRSDEHTSDLQSLMRTSFAVFRLEKNTGERAAARTPDDRTNVRTLI